MSLSWIITLAIIVVVSGAFLLFYYLFLQKELYFKKHIQVGDMCIYYPNEDEDKLCTVVEISGDIIKIKDSFVEFHVTHINNITSK